jgi:protein SCO1/2
LITARTKIVTALGAFALLAGCAAHAGFPAYSTVPDFTLTDQSGAAFNSSAQLKNNVWIADFIYTRCPGPCPRMSSQMHSIEDALSGVDGVRLVSFTVDPERDTPKVLADYAERFSAKRGVWFFLTGPPDSLQHLSRDVFMLGNVDGNLEHSTRFVLIDRASKIRGYYQSDEPGVTVRLVADTKRLLREPN